jgi:quinol-cytochrome oxidoreductase complex cytochrome b subunit
MPLIGPALASILAGGSEVAGPTLGRIYTVHSVLLPGLFVGLFVAHRLFVSWLREQREKRS